MRTFDLNKTHLYGRTFNLSIMATQLLIMVAITSVFATGFVFIFAMLGVNNFGVDSVFTQANVQYESIENSPLINLLEKMSDIIDLTPKILAAAMAAAVILLKMIDIYLVAMLLTVAFFTFLTIRYVLTNKNAPIEANEQEKDNAAKMIVKLEKTLGISPIAIGQHTAFNRSTLVLSLNDVGAALNSKIGSKTAQVVFKVNHEICHKISWDVGLGYMVKIITMFNCAILAFFYSYMTNSLVFTFITLKLPLLNFIAMYLIGYCWFQLFFKAFHFFSMFKEHLADEYALLKTQSLTIAKSALQNLKNSELNKRHPARQTRLDYLQHRQSTLPLKLFLMINLIWMMAYIIPTHINISLFVKGPWINVIFMILNSPLIVLITTKNPPQATRWLSSLATTLILALLLFQSFVHYYLFTHYNPDLAETFISHFGNNLSLYHGWFLLTLMLAQWPKNINSEKTNES